jgi:hypothetical protein
MHRSNKRRCHLTTNLPITHCKNSLFQRVLIRTMLHCYIQLMVALSGILLKLLVN